MVEYAADRVNWIPSAVGLPATFCAYSAQCSLLADALVAETAAAQQGPGGVQRSVVKLDEIIPEGATPGNSTLR